MKFHQYADMFPLIHGEAFVELKKDIKEKGLIDPIVTYQGVILDGRNRFRACQETGVEPDYFEYGGRDPLGYVISTNLKRRHLDESQRAMIAAKLANIEQSLHRTNAEQTSQSEAASLLNVSERSVNNAKKIQTSGTTQLQAEVERGNIKVTPAARIATLPPESQAAAILSMVKPAPPTAREKSLARDAKSQAKRKEPYVRFWGEVMHGKLPPEISKEWLEAADNQNIINEENIEEITSGVKTIIAYWQNALEVLENGK